MTTTTDRETHEVYSDPDLGREMLRSCAHTVAQLAHRVAAHGPSREMLDASASAADWLRETAAQLAAHGGACAGALHALHIASLLRVAADGAGLTLTQRQQIIAGAGYLALGLHATLPTNEQHREHRRAARERTVSAA